MFRHTDGRVLIWLMDGAGIKSGGIVAAAGTVWTIAGVGDFDGDGKSDILFRHTDGRVLIWLMDGAGIKSGGIPAAPGTVWTIH